MKLLREKLERFRRSQPQVRRDATEDIFERKLYLYPSSFEVANYSHRTPLVSFNPGALVKDKTLYIFPRMIFDYYKYVSSIAFLKVSIEDVLNGRLKTPLRCKILIWPRNLWEFLGAEDARAHLVDDRIYILYTGKGYYLEEKAAKRRDVLGFAEIDHEGSALRKAFFRIRGKEGDYLTPSNKDSTFLWIKGDKAMMLTRPEIAGLRICWRAEVDLKEHVILEDALTPVMNFENWELKVGWSTNAVRLSRNEFLVGWHGMLRDDLSYRNGLAIVDDQGELLAVSDYLLSPKGLVEEYGDRPLVIFGDGLILYKETLIWVGGVSDYIIGVFTTQLQKALDKLRWLRG
ncbi:MAG: glycosidase [Thermoprotei archaeon]|nr:MAG: glycosidase [Thermoprotei archaeon]